jgi:hypothetical protein
MLPGPVIFGESGIPPSPRSIEILGLAAKWQLIYWAQLVAGKILISKSLVDLS